MAFGSFEVKDKICPPVHKKEKREKEKKEKKPQAAGVRRETAIKGETTFRILLAGRNLSIMQEFLCSMNQNMGEALSSFGFSFYTRELETISCLTEIKKKLEQFFWSFTDRNWTYMHGDDISKEYTFSISVSGNQSKTLDLLIRCITPDTAGEQNWEQIDALWLLSDGGLFYEPEDQFFQYLKNTLELLPKRSEEKTKPVCLIQSQIEQIGHFGGQGHLSVLPAKTAEKIYAICRAHFMSDAPVALIPVQVYGGMECIGMDENHSPLLHIGQDAFCQSYIPDNCEIPCLYTVQALYDRLPDSYFSNAQEGHLTGKIYRYCSEKSGEAKWNPAWLTAPIKEEI